jgi:hypothetical protein
VFVANEILTAGAVNTNLMDQAVMVFADAAARTTALGSPSEGMVTYLEDTDSLELYTTVWGPVSPAITRADLPAGSVLQVVSTTKTDTFSTTSTSFTDFTGLSATITPKATSSTILILVNINGGVNNQFVRFNILRGSTAIAQPGGGSQPATATFETGVNLNAASVSFSFVDSPATSSSVTYKIQGATNSGTFFVNRSNASADRTSISTITLMEVAG